MNASQRAKNLLTLAKEIADAAASKAKSTDKNIIKTIKQKIASLSGPLVGTVSATSSLEDKLIADIKANACQALNLGCFAAGTKLWTESGWRNVEEIVAWEKVYSKDQWSPADVVELREVEEVFKRFAVVQVLHLAGGKIIRTTGEHPFYDSDFEECYFAFIIRLSLVSSRTLP